MFDRERDYLSVRRLNLEAREAEFEALVATAPEAAQAALRLAIDRTELEGAMAGGEVLARHGLLRPEDRLHIASALSADHRFSRAAALWAEVVADDPRSAGAQFALAEALAAQGLVNEARGPAGAALAGKSKPKVLDLARWLKSIAKLEAEPPSWARLRLLTDYYIGIGCEASARRSLESIQADPPSGEPEADDALRLVEAALTVRAPRAAKRLMQHITGDLARSDAGRTARIRMADALGLPKDAAERADVFLPPLSADDGLTREAVRPRRRLRYHAAEAFAAAGRYEDAIRQLGALVTADRHDFAAMTALQRCSGDAVLARVKLAWAAPRPPRIINLLPYSSESLMLELRRHEMGGWVNHFVLVEATQTFTGKPKPLHFAADPQRFGFGDQLIHVAVEGFPEWADTAWARDFHQRDMAVAGLSGLLRPDDIILITDADEIVDRRALEGYWPHLAGLRMTTSKYFLNYTASPDSGQADHRCGAICRGEHLARFGISYIRTALAGARRRWQSVPRAGWHFTSMGDTEALVEKFGAYAHQERGKSLHKDRGFIDGLLNDIRSGAPERGWRRVPIDDGLPRFVVENRDRLAELLLPTA